MATRFPSRNLSIQLVEALRIPKSAWSMEIVNNDAAAKPSVNSGDVQFAQSACRISSGCGHRRFCWFYFNKIKAVIRNDKASYTRNPIASIGMLGTICNIMVWANREFDTFCHYNGISFLYINSS